jgi:nitrate/nitrite-specific signal transduction histidine kinase
LFLSHFLAVFLVSGSVGTFFYLNAIDSQIESLRSRLQNSAALLSHGISAREMDAIRGPADVEQAAYRMSEELGRTRTQADRTLQELRQARDGLEDRVRERTQELQKAVERVQVLRGLFPICSSCNKIRDDQGYWHQVEQFVEMHTDARFTHGLCPACCVKLYGDLAKG